MAALRPAISFQASQANAAGFVRPVQNPREFRGRTNRQGKSGQKEPTWPLSTVRPSASLGIFADGRTPWVLREPQARLRVAIKIKRNSINNAHPLARRPRANVLHLQEHGPMQIPKGFRPKAGWRLRLPWVRARLSASTPMGLRPWRGPDATPSGLGRLGSAPPRVGPQTGQPWALGRNPVGIPQRPAPGASRSLILLAALSEKAARHRARMRTAANPGDWEVCLIGYYS